MQKCIFATFQQPYCQASMRQLFQSLRIWYPLKSHTYLNKLAAFSFHRTLTKGLKNKNGERLLTLDINTNHSV